MFWRLARRSFLARFRWAFNELLMSLHLVNYSSKLSGNINFSFSFQPNLNLLQYSPTSLKLSSLEREFPKKLFSLLLWLFPLSRKIFPTISTSSVFLLTIHYLLDRFQVDGIRKLEAITKLAPEEKRLNDCHSSLNRRKKKSLVDGLWFPCDKITAHGRVIARFRVYVHNLV